MPTVEVSYVPQTVEREKGQEHLYVICMMLVN
jgi:hypothetical protein